MTTVQSFYDDLLFPGQYTVEDVASYHHGWRNEFVDFIDSHMQDGLQVLDVGCGTGLITNVMAHRWRSDFEALDFALGVNYGRHMARQCDHHNTTWHHIDFMRFKSDRKFDVIICQGVLHHMPGYLYAAQKLTELLKPNGTLLLGLYHPMGKALQKAIGSFKNEILEVDQMHNPYETSFTQREVSRLFSKHDIVATGPSRWCWLDPSNGGLKIYVIRKVRH